MDYKISDKVVYPNHGVGVIEQINYGVLNGKTERYYMIRIVSSGLRVMVPETNAMSVGLRSVMKNNDTTKVLGFFALTGLEFNLTAIAALLTLIGYSVNDKVVVYDRMRENLRLHRAMPLRELIDLSINQTLARSLYTSGTAFLAMLPMAIAGGSAVSSFAIPMLFGIVICASSSVFIAAPILLFLGKKGVRMKTNAQASAAGAVVAGSGER